MGGAGGCGGGVGGSGGKGGGEVGGGGGAVRVVSLRGFGCCGCAVFAGGDGRDCGVGWLTGLGPLLWCVGLH